MRPDRGLYVNARRPSGTASALCQLRKVAAAGAWLSIVRPYERPLVCQKMHSVLAKAEHRLSQELGFRLQHVSAIDPGRAHNNRLFHLWAVDGREVVVKVYFRDDRDRLDREYSALSFLRGRGVTEVPTPYLRDDGSGFGVYSFETGTCRLGPELTEQHVEAMAAFAAELHHIHPVALTGIDLRTAGSATFSFEEQVAGIRQRLQAFTDFAAAPGAFESVRELCREIDVAGEVERLIRSTLDGVVDARVPRASWSLATGDLAPHNILVRDDGSIRVLDFEYSGWDDPVIAIGDFLSSDSAAGLTESCIDAYQSTFRELAGLTAEEVQRSRRVAALMEIGWITVHLSLAVPERFAAKQFADPSFDVHAHVSTQLAKARARLARIQDVLPAILAR